MSPIGVANDGFWLIGETVINLHGCTRIFVALTNTRQRSLSLASLGRMRNHLALVEDSIYRWTLALSPAPLIQQQ